MKSHLKIHAIAIAAIIVIVTMLYILTSSKTPTGIQSQESSSKTISISSATWGANCNTAIAEALRNPPPRKESDPLPAEPLKMVESNNVLDALKTSCDGKSSCNVKADHEALGANPMNSCFKRLAVSYRCFQFDSLTTLDIGQGDMLHIDCHSKNTNAAENPAAQ